MRRIICLLAVAALCFSLALPVFAWDFVPSISYKPTPEMDGAALVISAGSGEDAADEVLDIHGCIVVTSITQAEEKTTDIEQEARDELLEVYARLTDGSMDLFAIPEEYFEEQDPDAPTLETHTNMGMSYEGKNYVVVQLVDVSFAKTICIDGGHGHREILEREDVNATLDFNLGVSRDAVVVVLQFHNGQWQPVTSTVNNGDGTVTCVMEHFCPVAFCIEAENLEAPQVEEGNDWYQWAIMLAVCTAGVIILVLFRKKKKEE